jgi:hypothetical protein
MAVKGGLQSRCAVGFQDLRGILSGQGDCLQAVAEGTEDVVGADGGLTAGGVVVERDEEAGLAKIGGAAERAGRCRPRSAGWRRRARPGCRGGRR